MFKKSMLLGALMLTALSAQATEPATPRLDQRQENQERRIEQGKASGELTLREATRLENRHENLASKEATAKSDGVVSKKERAQLHVAAESNSRAIARKKHNRRSAGN